MHRKTIYTILRISLGGDAVCVLDSFRTLERAEEVKGVYQQQLEDRGMFPMFFFEIQTSTYYDE